MSHPVSPVPAGFHTVTPYLVVADAAALVSFVERAFGGTVVRSHRDDAGRVRHAEMRVGDAMIMLAQGGDAWPPLPAALYLYVPQVDEVYRAALVAGATSISEPTDHFYGDRGAGVKDTNGLTWWLGTHFEDVSDEEIERRVAAMAAAPQK